jgi:rubrerythrin
MYILSGIEVVKLGIQVEKNGKDFYSILAEQSKIPKTKQIYQYLAKEEEKHITTFKQIAEKLEDYKPAQSYEGEYLAYMSALAAEYVFTKEYQGKQIAKNIQTEKEAIELGIGFEKDSIIFFEGMKRLVPEDDKEIIDKLIAEEEIHLNRLLSLKKDLIE